MSHTRLDQLALGELSPAEATTAQAHLQSCAACSATNDALVADRQAFAAETNVGALAADALARAERGHEAPAPWWRRHWPVWAPAGLALAGLVLVLAPRGDRGADEIRTKGAFGLSLYVLHTESGAVATDGRGGLHLGEALHPGDQVRFGLRGGVAKTAAGSSAASTIVLGLEEAGKISVYHAAQASTERLTAAGSTAPEQLLPEAIELDQTLGNETLVALRCSANVTAADAVAAAQRGAGGKLGLPCDEVRYVIKKVAR
ncbi:MAG TPA: zf-HC2 domain-containing protein [Polyangia bacterium]